MMTLHISKIMQTCLRPRAKARLSVVIAMMLSCVLHAQVTTVPFFASPNDSIIVQFDASEGNGALKSITGDIYAHTGIITALSTSPTDWKYVKAQWTENTAACKLKRVNGTRYELAIGRPHTFYNVPPNELIRRLAFVFRTADGSIVGRAADGADIYAEVYAPGAYVKLLSPTSLQRIVDSGTVVRVSAAASAGVTLLQLAVNNREIGRTTQDRISVDHTITQTSKIEVIGYTSLGGAIKDSITIRVRTKPRVEDVPVGMKDGINILNDSTAVLVLYAPGKQEVYAVGPFSNWSRDPDFMCSNTADAARWWCRIPLDKSGQTMFQWSVDDDDRISDPYSEQVSDPNDRFIPAGRFPALPPYPSGSTAGIVSVINTTLPDYAWKTTSFTKPDPDRMVVYELLVRDFTSASSFQGVIDSLPYLKNLGVQAIQLMPVMEFEGNDSWGYNPSHMFAVDKYYGTKNDLKRLIDAAHGHGLAVIFDIVLNHQFGQSPLVNIWGAVSGPTADNPYFNVTPRHPFNVGYDMNHESKVTRDYSKRVLQYWVREFKIDGYRFDLSKGLTQTNSGQDAGLMSRYDASRIAILKDYASAVRAVDPTSIVIYEHFADNDEEKELSRDGSLLWANGTWSGAQAILGFDNQDVAGAVSAQRRGFQRHGLIGYVESHDEERMLVRGVEARDTTTVINRLEALMVTLLCIPGPKMLWQFNEVAYPHSINLNGRLGRKPLAWPLLSDGRRERLRRAVAELSTARQLYASFASMSATLQTYDKLKTIVLKDPSCDVVLIANLDVTTRTSTIPFTRKGVWYEFFRDTTDAYYIDNATVTLRPGEYRLWSTQPLRGSATTGAIDEGHVSVANNADVYPNPASEAIHVRIPEAATSVAVVDVLGRVRWSTSDTSVSAWSIDCSTWPTGTYSLRIASLHDQQVSTFVVQR